MPNASVRHASRPRCADLGHLVGAHPLRGHPVQRLRRRPVAAQADLQEPVPAQRAGLDQPAHRLAVPPQRAELDVAGVGVRVEVEHRHPAVAEHVGHPVGVGEGDRVVAAEHDGDRAGAGHRLDGRLAARAAPSRCRRRTSPRRRRRAPGGPAGRRCAAPGSAATRRAAGSRSSGSPAARTGCPAGATCRRRRARRGPRRRRRRRRRGRRGRSGRRRGSESGPNWAP